MAFTYTDDLTVPRDFVRFHTGDTIEDQSFLSDDIITSLLATSDSQEAAVIEALQYIITRFSQPNFRADWLQVDNASARKGYQTMLAEKRRQFGLNVIRAVAKHTYRADGMVSEAPDYD